MLMPFYTFTTMSYNNEALRTLLMNVILFLPLGLALPYVKKEKKVTNGSIAFWKGMYLV